MYDICRVHTPEALADHDHQLLCGSGINLNAEASMVKGHIPLVVPYPARISSVFPESVPCSSSPRRARTLCPSIHSMTMMPDSTSTTRTSGARIPFRTQRASALASAVILERVNWADRDGWRYFFGKRYFTSTGCDAGDIRNALKTFYRRSRWAKVRSAARRRRTASAPCEISSEDSRSFLSDIMNSLWTHATGTGW